MLKNMVVINGSTKKLLNVTAMSGCNKVQSKSIWKDVDYIIPLIGNTEGCNLEEALL